MRHADGPRDGRVDFGGREAEKVRLLDERDLKSKANVAVEALVADEPRKRQVERELDQIKQSNFRIVSVSVVSNVR